MRASRGVLVAALVVSFGAAGQVVGTLAGGGDGEGRPGLEASFAQPTYVAVDGAGNVYVSDALYHRVRRIDTSGIVRTVAGTEESGYSGDGGPATEAQLNTPQGLSLDRSGGLLIADSRNRAIRRVDLATGRISTVAGDPTATAPPAGLGDGGPARQAWLWRPYGVHATAAGEILVTDVSGPTVRKVDASGVIRTIAGVDNRFGFNAWSPAPYPAPAGYVAQELALPATEAWLNQPRASAMLDSGDVLVADTFNYRMRLVDALTGLLRTAAGTWGQRVFGPPPWNPSTPIWYPAYGAGPVIQTTTDVAPGTAGSAYFLTQTATTIWHRSASGTLTPLVRTANGQGFNGDGVGRKLHFPAAFAPLPSGDFLVSDTGNVRLRRMTPGATPTAATTTTIAGGAIGDGRDPRAAAFNNAVDVAVAPSGAVYVADWDNNLIRRIDPDGLVSTVAGNVASAATAPKGIPFGTSLGAATAASLYRPTALAVDAAGNVYIADNWAARVLRLDTAGQLTVLASGYSVLAIALDEARGVLFFNQGWDLFSLDLASGAVTQLAVPPAGSPLAIALVWKMAMGPDGHLYLSDGNGGKLLRRSPAGVYSLVYAGGGLGYAHGLAIDAQGNVFIGDQGLGRVLRLSPSGELTVVAGSRPGFVDDAPAHGAQLQGVDGIALDRRGNLIVASAAYVRIVARNALDALDLLIRRVERREPQRELLAPLQAARAAIERGNQDAARGQLQAFAREAAARADRLAPREADKLAAAAGAIEDLLAARGRPTPATRADSDGLREPSPPRLPSGD